MKGFQKDQLLKSVNVLQEAGGVLEQQESGPEKINLCADMQEFIFAILNFLDNIEEEDAELTDSLCELYKTLLKVSQDEIPSGQINVEIHKIRDYVEKKESTY